MSHPGCEQCSFEVMDHFPWVKCFFLTVSETFLLMSPTCAGGQIWRQAVSSNHSSAKNIATVRNTAGATSSQQSWQLVLGTVIHTWRFVLKGLPPFCSPSNAAFIASKFLQKLAHTFIHSAISSKIPVSTVELGAESPRKLE